LPRSRRPAPRRAWSVATSAPPNMPSLMSAAARPASRCSPTRPISRGTRTTW